MKRILSMLFVLFILTASVCSAEDYMYFSSGDMQLLDAIDGSSMTKLGEIYYATDAQGRLLKTQIFTEWLHENTVPSGGRLITNHRADADKVLFYADGVLYVSYDGVTFAAVPEYFAPDAVLRYMNGLYTAVEKAEGGFALRYSFDGVQWYAFPEVLTASAFSVLHIDENRVILKGVQSVRGTQDVLLSKAEPQTPLFFEGLVYESGVLVDSPNYEGAVLVYADKTSDNRFLYVYRAAVTNGYKYSVVRTNADGSLYNTSAVIADASMQMYVYNDTICMAKSGASLNLINLGGNEWYQVTDDMAFPLIRSAEALSKDVFFDAGLTKQYYCKNARTMNLHKAGIEVNLNGSYIAFDSAPQMINDRTMVPLRAISEALGCTVEYAPQTQEICITRTDGVCLNMQVGSAKATKTWADGVKADLTLDAAPVIINDRTLVPVRFVSESLDLTVEWVDAMQTVVLR